MNLFKALSVVTITLALFSIAKAGNIPGPKPKPAGDLNLWIVTSDSPGYLQEWLNTPSSQGDELKRLDVAKPEQPVVTSFLVTGFTPDQYGNISTSVSFAFLDPNGKVVFNERNYSKVSGKAPKKLSFIMAEPALNIVLEKSDPEGVYTIIGIAEDLVNNKAVRRSYKIQYVKN